MKLRDLVPKSFLFSVAVFALAWAGCGSSETQHGGFDAGATAEDPPADASMLVCEGSETKSCTCSNGMSGRKTCKSNRFGGCVCGVPSTDAGPSLSTADLCKAGYYVGNFVGMYLPAMSGGGLVPSDLGVMVSGKALNDIPALSFTLDESDNGPAGEFHSFSVGNGCMAGSAQVFGLIDNPFVARITGSLDCATGYFDGWLDGQYTLFNLSPIPTAFSGPFTAQFYLPQSLKDGEWDVSEGTSALTGGSSGGGKGSWSADWTADDGPDAAVDPCAAIPPSDGGVHDAGARRDAATLSDAGAH